VVDYWDVRVEVSERLVVGADGCAAPWLGPGVPGPGRAPVMKPALAPPVR
jgi:hypothetical protein